MFNFDFSEIALIGAVALIVIGPERLPRVARTVGTMAGRARRYVADVKAEVNRTIELEELQKVKSQFESAARDVEQSVQRDWNEAQSTLRSGFEGLDGSAFASGVPSDSGAAADVPGWEPPPPVYLRPNKRWRVKRAAVPGWYKQREGVRRHVQSGAARVARHRPKTAAPR